MKTSSQAQSRNPRASTVLEDTCTSSKMQEDAVSITRVSEDMSVWTENVNMFCTSSANSSAHSSFLKRQ